jgi:hypothetical protein
VGDPQPWKLLGTTRIHFGWYYFVCICDPCLFCSHLFDGNLFGTVTRTEDRSDHDGFAYALVLHYPSATSVADPSLLHCSRRPVLHLLRGSFQRLPIGPHNAQLSQLLTGNICCSVSLAALSDEVGICQAVPSTSTATDALIQINLR